MKLAAAVLFAAGALCATADQASSASWTSLGRADPDHVLTFSVAMPIDNADKLDDAFWKVSNPESEHYGEFMTVKEVNELTATRKEVVAATQEALESHGARCLLEGSRTALRCEAEVSAVEKMLKTEIHAHKHVKDAREIHRLPEGQGYTWPQELTGALFMTNLVGFPEPRYGQSKNLVMGPAVVPSTLSGMYNIKAQGNAKVVQSAAEFQGLSAFTNSDLSTFNTNTGASVSVAKHVGSFDQTFPQAESTLDVEYLGSTGTGNTNWYWTESQWMYDFTTSALSGKNPLPDIFSMSYGWSEAAQCQISPSSQPCSTGGSTAFVQTVNANFQKMGTTGVTLLASSGDSGAHGRTDPMCSKQVTSPAFPASSPYVTAVGATQIAPGTATTGGTEKVCTSGMQCITGGQEVVCNKDTGAMIASGGGFSNVAAMPQYQESAVASYLKNASALPGQGNFNASGRGFPDVSAFGHNYYIELGGSEQGVDGTSCSCPVFAGVIGLMNANRVNGGKSKIGFANPLLYKLAASNPASFQDIVQGNNKCTEQSCGCTGFDAAPGWDATTGLGSPNVGNLISADSAMLGLPTPALRGSN